jgi:hypothetical protein
MRTDTTRLDIEIDGFFDKNKRGKENSRRNLLGVKKLIARKRNKRHPVAIIHKKK